MPQDAAARRERFERLHAAHIGVVTAWAFRRDTDRERARDLVAETFLGPAPSPAHRVVHKNGKLTDNAVTNLEWRVPG